MHPSRVAHTLLFTVQNYHRSAKDSVDILRKELYILRLNAVIDGSIFQSLQKRRVV